MLKSVIVFVTLAIPGLLIIKTKLLKFTYRVYDYGRKDKNGKERELHIDKALKVTNLNKFTPISFDNCLGKCEYFTVHKYEIDGEMQLHTNEKSFQYVTCVKGNGFIEETSMEQGNSYFVPANINKYTIKGKVDIIVTACEENYE